MTTTTDFARETKKKGEKKRKIQSKLSWKPKNYDSMVDLMHAE